MNIKIAITSLLILIFCVNGKIRAIHSDQKILIEIQKASHSYFENPDSSSTHLKNIIKANPQLRDSLAQLIYYQLNKIERLRQHFADGFEYAEKGLRIAERVNDSLMIALLCQDLGDYYTEFGKEDISHQHLKRCLYISKKLFDQGKASSNRLTGAHFHLAKHYRNFGHLGIALTHLDSCEIIGKANHHVRIYDSYHRSEQARIYADIGNIDTAQQILNELDQDISNRINDPAVNYDLKGFLAVVNLYLGDTFLKEKDFVNAIRCYTKAMKINNQYKRYNTLQSQIHEHKAIAEFAIQHYDSAYLSLLKAKQLKDENFSITSTQNQSLIEVRSKDRAEIEAQKLELLEKDKLVSEQAKSLWVVRGILGGIVFLGIISMLLFRNRMQKQRFKKEQQENAQRQKEAAQEFAIKNKELTAYTLKLIDKDKTIDDLLQKLKEGKTDPSTVKSIEKSIQFASKTLWEDFNSRFIAVNSDFYDRLLIKYPDLSKTERKHCALIKLNFSGKEMAHLLGISVTSVHVSRYRLRKRFNLAKNQNLTDFIAGI